MSRVLFLSFLLLIFVAPASAQEKLTLKEGMKVVREVSRVIEKNYVFPEKGKAMTAKLSQGIATRRYSVSDPVKLAALITEDMQAASNDGHMSIVYDPAQAAARRSSPSGGDRPDMEHFKKLMAETNHGITELKILPGNIRYINISHWPWDPERTPKVYDDAMRFLRGGDAYIIDVRASGGGADDAVTYLTSHFMEPGRKLMIFRSGPTEAEETFSVKVSERKLPQRPLFMLIGPASASAPEGAAAHVKHFDLGTLVGATTAGAGNSNDLFPIDPGFVLSVSTAAGIHPVTNSSWEGIGIKPDIAVPAPAALDRAHLEALKALAQTGDAEKKNLYAWHAQSLEAKLNPPALSAASLNDFPGRYENGRIVSRRGGNLYYKRADGLERELLPIADNLFALGEYTSSTRLRFNRVNGAVTGASFVTQAAADEHIMRLGG